MVAHNLQLKNFALMRRVFSQVHRQNPLVRLVVLGKRPPPCTAPWLIYAASTESPEQIYAACDALVHPTFYDACANVVLEAMACGLPVLSSDRNGSAELLDPDMRRALEPAKWAEWIAAVSDDLDYRQLLAVAARHCAENHGIEEYIMQFEELLARLVGDHPLGQQS